MDSRILDTLRQAVRRSQRTSTEIGKALGINPVSVRKFSAGTIDLSLPNLVKLAELEGYKLNIRLEKISKNPK